MKLLIVAAVVVLALFGFGWLARARPRAFSQLLLWLVMGSLVLVGLWLVLTGRLAGLLAIATGLSPWVLRGVQLHRLWRSFLIWRRHAGKTGRPRQAKRPSSHNAPAATLSEAEARSILGVSDNAGPDEIRAAHRRLMMAHHPDHGGSSWIAARLNLARDRLLNDA